MSKILYETWHSIKKNKEYISPLLLLLTAILIFLPALFELTFQNLWKPWQAVCYATIEWSIVITPILIALLAFYPKANTKAKWQEKNQKYLTIVLVICALFLKPITDKKSRDAQDNITTNFKVALGKSEKIDSQSLFNLIQTKQVLEKSNLLLLKTTLLENLAIEKEYPLFPATIDLEYQINYAKSDFTNTCPESLRYLTEGNTSNRDTLTTEEREFFIRSQPTILGFERDTTRTTENSRLMIPNMLSAPIVLQKATLQVISTKDSLQFIIRTTDIEFKPPNKDTVNQFRSIPDLVGKFCRLQLPVHPHARVSLNTILYKTTRSDQTFKLKYKGIRPHITGYHQDFITLIKKEDINIAFP